ncbi:MAG: hypothetical protein AAGA85_05075 [Bacteroidota bacterium]
METVFFEEPSIVKAYLDSEMNAVVVVWDNLYDGDIVKECCLAQLDQVKQGAKYVIVETSKAQGVPPQDTQDFFTNTLFPNFQAEGLKAVITVVPTSALTKLAAKKWTNRGKPFGFEMFEAASLEDAKRLTKDLTEATV